jgi:DNA transformation protein
MKAVRKPGATFTAFVLDQLRGLGPVEARKMFGGEGLYWNGQIFGLIDEGRLYFRVADSTLARYQAVGSKPFEPWPGHIMKGYYEVPAEVLEDLDAAAAWAREAWALPRARRRKPSAKTPRRAASRPKARKK